MKKLTKLQAYNVMLHFLVDFYEKETSEDIGDLLSDSGFFWDGRTTADPASWVKWKEALVLTMKQDDSLRSENRLTIVQAFHAMLHYIKIYRSLWGPTKDLDALIQELQSLYTTYNKNNAMWKKWFKFVDEVSAMSDPRVQKQLSK